MPIKTIKMLQYRWVNLFWANECKRLPKFCKTFPQVTSSSVNGKDSENSHFLQVHCRCGLHQRSVRSQFNPELKFLDHHLTVFWGLDITKLLLVSEDTKLPAWSIRPVQASRGVSAAEWMVQGAREDLDWHRSSHRIFKYLNKMLVPIMHISQRSLIKESFEWWHGVGVLLVANCEVAWGKYVEDIISVPLFTDVRRQRFSDSGILSCMQMQIRVKRRRIWRREGWAVKEFVQRTRISHKKVPDIHSGASVCQEIKMSKLTGFPLLCPLPYSDRCR